MQRNYNEGQDAVSYAQQFRTAYEYGQDGRDLENMKGSSTFRTLNEAQLSMAYELGRAARNSAQQAAPKSVGMRVGNVDTTAIRGMRLNTAQNASVNFMSRLAKTAGFNVRFVATSANAQGQYTEENGSYDRATRTITIDVNAGRLNTSSFNYAMIHTAGHELTHFIKEFGDANLYNAYQEFVLGHLSGKMSENKLNRRIAQTIAANKKLGKELSREEAIDEVVADASADLLSKMTEQDMQQLAEQNPSLLKRIKNFIQRWVKGMKALLKTAVSGQQTSNDLAKQMEDVIDEQYGKWMELFKNATENARKADAEADGTVPDQAVHETAQTGDVQYMDDVVYSTRVTDSETLDFLENQETITTYRSMQIVDGKLYPPMAAVVAGAHEDASEIGKWEMATEHPELVIRDPKTGKYQFNLQKGKGRDKGTDVKAAYNPYMHSSNLPLNDQFSSAYKRPNLVTVECEVPVSELTSGYQAQYAKDPVGWHAWHAGPVAGKVRKQRGIERQVFLSRWLKPVRIIPDAEVAQMYREILGDTDIAVPDNVVSPSLLTELKKAGVPIAESGKVSDGVQFMARDAFDNPDDDVYNTDGMKWTYNILSDQEQEQLNEALHNITDRNYKAYIPTNDGEFIVGVEEAIVFTNGNYNDPTVSMIVRFDVIDPTDTVEKIMERLKNESRKGKRSQDIDRDESREIISAVLRESAGGSSLALAEFFTPVSGDAYRRSRGTGSGASGGNQIRKTSEHDSSRRYLTKHQQRYFANSQARDRYGRLMRLYHGSSVGRIEYFKTVEGHRNGLYLSTNPKVADQFAMSLDQRKNKKQPPRVSGTDLDVYYNNVVYELYANTTNPFVIDAGRRMFNMVKTPKAMSATGKYGDTVSTDDIAKWARSEGYDGVIVRNVKESYGILTDDVIVFDKNQVKFIDNDDPTGDDSALLQVRDPSQITDREILANAMDSMAETQAELDWVKRYRKNIGELNEKQRQMDEINADIVRMSNEDPKGNRDEIIRQQNRAKILASQIDRYDKRLLEFEAGKPLKAVVERERTKLKDKAKADLRKYAETTREAAKQREAEQREKYQAILSDVRSKRDEALSKLRKEKNAKIEELRSEKNAKIAELQREKTEAVKKVREEKNESFSRQKYLERVQKDSATLREWLTHPTNKAHVPEFLRKPLGEFMESLDFSSKRSLSGGAQTQADQRMLNAMRDLHEALSKSHGMSAAEFGGYVDLTGNFLEQFTELRNDIERAMQGETAKLQELRDRLAVTKDPAKRAELEARIKGYETSLGTPVNLMTSQQLRALSEMITTLNTSIRKMNTALGSARQLTISGMSKNTIDNVDKIGQRKAQFDGIGAVGDFWNWNNTTPIYVFKRFGAGGQAIFEELQDGWDKLAMLADKVVKFTEDTYKSEEVAAWNKQIHEFNLNGQTVRMTATQLMSLYCLNRRDQGRQHLLGGGIRVAEMKSKGKTVSDAADHMLNEAVLDEMLSKLTKRQIEVADALQAYMSNECAKLGNEISMKRFGYEMFTESMYFPIEVDKNNLRRINEEQTMGQSIFRLLNLSSTKPLQQGANNALVLRDIFDVFASHTSDMAKYNALALPVLDMIKWYNYVEKLNSNGEPYNPETDSGQAYQTRSVQKSLEGAFGNAARRYVENFLKDLNGDTEGGREDGMFNRLISRYKVASVAANLRVGMLQITSLPRAAYAINPKYLFSGIAKWNTSRGKISKTARDKVGIAKWKSLGFYDTSISRNMRELIKHDESTIDKVRQGSMKLAELGDSWTMGVLYGAVEAEMRDKHKELKPGSEEYNRQVNARMREIVYQTQVVDSTMTRSQFMRSKGFATLATAFMSEPTLAMNMLNDSIFEARMKSRAGEKWSPLIYTKVSRALGVWMVTSAISAAVEALFSAMRDDDEFESFWEKYSDALLGDYDDAESFGDRWTAFWAGSFGGNLNPFDDIPILKDFISAYKGETSAPMWAAAFGELGDGVNRLITVIRDGGSPAEIYGAIYKLVGGMSKSTGIAASNAMRDIVSVYNTFLADRMGWRRVQTYDDSEGKAADAMIEAMIAGDEEAIEKAYERAGIYDMDPDKIADALAKRIDEAYVSGRIDRSTADRLLTEHGGKRARDAEDMLTEADYERATGHEHGKMKSDYLSGLLTEEEVREYLTEYDGMREGEIEERLGEWNYERDTGYVYSQMKADYIDGELTEEQVMEYRMEYGGAEEGDVTTLLGKWNYERDTGLAWSDMRLDYADGVISESELRTYLSKYGGKDEEQIEETVSNYDYQIATGRTTTAPKYWRIAYAYESGGDYEAYIDEAFNQIMYGGDKRKTWKQARNSIASSVASYYKKTYLAVAGTPEGDRMLERILDVYEAIGYNRSEQRRHIAENWFNEA